MNFYLEKLTRLEINHRNSDLELIIEDFGNNKVSIMRELIDKFGFDLVFDSLCENGLKELKSELDEKISEVE